MRRGRLGALGDRVLSESKALIKNTKRISYLCRDARREDKGVQMRSWAVNSSAKVSLAASSRP